MTTPYLRTKALVQAKELLGKLAEPAELDNVPQAVREVAQNILRHFPTLVEVQRIHEALPDLLGPAPPFSRLSGNSETVNTIEATRDAGL